MKRYSLYFLFCCCFIALPGFSNVDTNAINKWNQQALDLAYSEPARAMTLADKAYEKSKEIHFSRGEVRALIRKGIIYDVQSKNELAIEMYEQSLQLSKNTNDQKGIASNFNNLGLIYWKINDLTKALKYINKAYRMFGKLNDSYSMASAANNMGLIYEEMELYDKSLVWGRKAVAHALDSGDDATLYDIYSNMGNVFQSIDQQDSSQFYSRKAIEGYRKSSNKYGLGMSLCNLAISLKNTANIKESIPLFLESMDLAEEIGHEYSYVSSGVNLSESYHRLKLFDEEKVLLLKIYPRMLRLKSNELGYKVCFALGKSSYHFGDDEAGAQYFRQYLKYHDAYFKSILSKNLAEAETKFELRAERERNKLEKQQSKLKLKQQEQRRFLDNLIWVVIFGVVIFSSVLIFFMIRKRNLQKELINQRSVFNATIEERKRISYDLHDHVGSQLSYVVNNLELIKHSDGENERVNRTFAMSQAAMNSLRDTVWALHSEELTMGALAERMENLARKTFENNSNIQLLFRNNVDVNRVVPQHFTMHIIRVFQEAVHNVFKHAKATQLEIMINEYLDELNVTVADNGIGLSENPSKPYHYGLESMRERAQKIGGQLVFTQRVGGGTAVCLSWKKNNSNA